MFSDIRRFFMGEGPTKGRTSAAHKHNKGKLYCFAPPSTSRPLDDLNGRYLCILHHFKFGCSQYLRPLDVLVQVVIELDRLET